MEQVSCSKKIFKSLLIFLCSFDSLKIILFTAIFGVLAKKKLMCYSCEAVFFFLENFLFSEMLRSSQQFGL